MGNARSKRLEDEKDKKSSSYGGSTIAAIVLGLLLAIAVIVIIILIATRPKHCKSASDLCFISKNDVEKLGAAQAYIKAMGDKASGFFKEAQCSPLSCPGPQGNAALRAATMAAPGARGGAVKTLFGK